MGALHLSGLLACLSATLLVASGLLHAVTANRSSSLRSRALAVPITEGTEPPENPPDNYSPCNSALLYSFYYDIYTENNECRSKTTYNWDAIDGKIPSTAAREEVCKCKLLIQKLQKVQVPHCLRMVNNVWCPYARVLEYEFGLCNVGNNTTPPVTEWPVECTATPEPTNPVKTTTPSPVKTTTPSPINTSTSSPFIIITQTPSPTETVDTTANHTAAIVGGTAASAAGIGIVFTITLRVRRKREEKTTKKAHNHDSIEERDVEAVGVIVSEPLSPLEDSPSSGSYEFAQTPPHNAAK